MCIYIYIYENMVLTMIMMLMMRRRRRKMMRRRMMMITMTITATVVFSVAIGIMLATIARALQYMMKNRLSNLCSGGISTKQDTLTSFTLEGSAKPSSQVAMKAIDWVKKLRVDFAGIPNSAKPGKNLESLQTSLTLSFEARTLQRPPTTY